LIQRVEARLLERLQRAPGWACRLEISSATRSKNRSFEYSPAAATNLFS
jgi:hypothetical protein